MRQPEMKYVRSSSVEAIGYDEDAHELWVRFVSGGTYVYSDVPRTTYHDFMRADSKGSYLNREVKPNYAFRAQADRG
jgi:hypothetical protein